jgi:esterase/lipase
MRIGTSRPYSMLALLSAGVTCVLLSHGVMAQAQDCKSLLQLIEEDGGFTIFLKGLKE